MKEKIKERKLIYCKEGQGRGRTARSTKAAELISKENLCSAQERNIKKPQREKKKLNRREKLYSTQHEDEPKRNPDARTKKSYNQRRRVAWMVLVGDQKFNFK